MTLEHLGETRLEVVPPRFVLYTTYPLARRFYQDCKSAWDQAKSLARRGAVILVRLQDGVAWRLLRDEVHEISEEPIGWLVLPGSDALELLREGVLAWSGGAGLVLGGLYQLKTSSWTKNTDSRLQEEVLVRIIRAQRSSQSVRYALALARVDRGEWLG